MLSLFYWDISKKAGGKGKVGKLDFLSKAKYVEWVTRIDKAKQQQVRQTCMVLSGHSQYSLCCRYGFIVITQGDFCCTPQSWSSKEIFMDRHLKKENKSRRIRLGSSFLRKQREIMRACCTFHTFKNLKTTWFYKRQLQNSPIIQLNQFSPHLLSKPVKFKTGNKKVWLNLSLYPITMVTFCS